MHKFVDDKEFLNRARKYSSNLINEMTKILREKYQINSNFFLIGSGAKNLVTLNGKNRQIDFDYNLNIISCNDWKDLKQIKENVRNAFNQILRKKGLRDVNDSTSVLTTKPIHFNNDDSKRWTIDLCIITEDNDGNWLRLIHEKNSNSFNDRYYWNESRNSIKYKEKIRRLKQIPGAWNLVREKYLERKNYYLKTQQSSHHSSFNCLIEVVNEIYQRYQ
ncbi:hypothetical protein [Mycoplasmopsis gallinarum]|uniref:Nucleotidyltransferase n=1 Tax=Mycoplasmopsis gallinarum TaxID=29557 RepID=A0A168R6U5_9BACT|nr:hypothetical protein [Mycoplasmopsis gallinarum]OAB48657.1 hypothetical protein MGALLINA_06230 [Mycoplasmopsis gallinarum]